MKHVILAVLLSLSMVLPVYAQEPETYKIFLPMVSTMPTINCPETWRIIKPDGTTNFTLNPSAETTGNFTAVGGGTATRVTTDSFFGLQSYRVQTNNNNEGIRLTFSTLGNETHFVTLRVAGKLPPSWDWSLDDTNYRAPVLIESIDADWDLYGLPFPASQASGSTTLYIRQNGVGDGDFFIDGIQVEEKNYWTTYCDGTQQGCAWNGTAHTVSSTRSAQSRAGGRVLDLWTDFGFFVEEVVGVGAAPETVDTRSYAILPGGELSGSKTESRNFTLIGRFIADSEQDLHAKRQELIEELGINTYPESQAIRIRFSGAEVQKQISAHYTGGLEAQLKVSYGPWQVEGQESWRKLQHWTERVAIQFLAPDPMWFEIGESSEVLDVYDKMFMRRIASRRRSTGQWDDLNNTTDPTTASEIDTIAIGPDGLIYIGGTFTGWNGVAGRDYIAVYDPVADSWASVGGASDFNNSIIKLIFGADGTLYAGGGFTNVAADADADYVAQWDGSNWTAVGQPQQGAAAITVVNDMAFDSVANLVIVGGFTDWANIANADYIVQWDGSSYSAIGSGGTGSVQAVAINQLDNIYIGGDFNNWAADANADKLAFWDGSTWAAVADTALNGIVSDLIFTNDDVLYIGGNFTDAAGIDNADRIVSYNGTSFSALGTGVNSNVFKFSIINNTLYVVGAFTEAGGISLTNRAARWNGASWAHLDIDFPESANPIIGLATGNQDPVVSANFDIYVGANIDGVATIAGLTVVENEGAQPAFPEFVFLRTDGRQASTGTIATIRNETTGKELLFDYGLIPGEQLIINLEPTAKSIISSFFGPRLAAILANSDFGIWSLQPDNNDVTVFVNVEPDEQNDQVNLLSKWDGISGISESNTDNGRLYVSVIDDGGGFFHVELYDDSARGGGDLVGHTATYNTTGFKAIVADGGSGLGGFIDVDNVTVADADIFVDFAIVNAFIFFKDTYRSLD